MVAHTPGPWMSFDSGTLVISASPGDLLIADLDVSEVDTNAEREANAHLIAAAPELLQALRDAAEHLDFCGYGDAYEREVAGDLRQRITAAIAKAEGRS
jgi:hypothetical protein